jgi:hypothetical protein
MKNPVPSRRAAVLAVTVLFAFGGLISCGGGSEVFLTPTVPPLGVPNPYDTPSDPYSKRREGLFPVQLLLPKTEVSVWTSVRREGDPEVDDELTFVVEGFVEAREGFFLDYDVILADDRENTYPTTPDFRLGLLAPGDSRKFEVAAQLPRDVRVTRIEFKSADGDVSRNLTYHIDLALARVPTLPLLPPGWDAAQ